MHWKYSDYVVGTTGDITRQRITLCFATSNPSIQDCFVRVPITECTALLMWHLHVRVEARRQLPVSFSGSHSPYSSVFIWEMGRRACWEVIVNALKEVEMGCRACWDYCLKGGGDGPQGMLGGYFVSIKGGGKAFSLQWLYSLAVRSHTI